MIKNAKELAQRCLDLAENYDTLYVLGAFGWPMQETNQQRAIDSYAYNRREDRAAKIRNADSKTFGFDCVCMVKALLWGFNADTDATYGGAKYASNGVPDINEGQMIQRCVDVSSDFSNVQAGEMLWTDGHMGIYVGNGLAVECTPIWADGVQITAVGNMAMTEAYPVRTWKKHAKLPWISYEQQFSLTMTMLRPGAKGEQVRAMQLLLIGRGFDCGRYGADGDFGNATRQALLAFQTSEGLQADAVAGPDTMRALLGVEK